MNFNFGDVKDLLMLKTFLEIYVCLDIFIIELIIGSEKLSVYGSLIGSIVEPWLNRWHHKYIIYKLLKFKIIIKIKIKIYILLNIIK